MIGPEGRALIKPIAITRGITAALRGSVIINSANMMHPTTSTDCGLLVQSARNPPAIPPSAASHNTMLMAEPAAVIDQPRSTSRVGPKLKIIAKPMLKRPQIRPAMITANRVLRSSREAAEGAAAAVDGGR